MCSVWTAIVHMLPSLLAAMEAAKLNYHITPVDSVSDMNKVYHDIINLLIYGIVVQYFNTQSCVRIIAKWNCLISKSFVSSRLTNAVCVAWSWSLGHVIGQLTWVGPVTPVSCFTCSCTTVVCSMERPIAFALYKINVVFDNYRTEYNSRIEALWLVSCHLLLKSFIQ